MLHSQPYTDTQSYGRYTLRDIVRVLFFIRIPRKQTNTMPYHYFLIRYYARR